MVHPRGGNRQVRGRTGEEKTGGEKISQNSLWLVVGEGENRFTERGHQREDGGRRAAV